MKGKGSIVFGALFGAFVAIILISVASTGEARSPNPHVISAQKSAQKSAQTSPASTASAGGTVRLNAALSHEYVPAGAAKNVHARIQLRAVDAIDAERAPLNLAVVIDRSGSMNGGRLDQAKNAAHSLVDRLSEQDRLAVVSYDDEVTVNLESVPVTTKNQDRLHSAINRIQLGGMTNIEGGLNKGAELIDQFITDDTVNRVILLSDGHANVGASNPQEFGQIAGRMLKRGISSSALGLGLDYNEKLMAAISTEGAGNYYFVESEKKLVEIFQDEFKSLASVVAKNAKITATVGPGVELLKIHGYPHDIKGASATIDLGAFYARQHKDILVDLAVSPRPEDARDILELRLDFADLNQNRSVFSNVELRAKVSADPAKLKIVDQSVMQRVEQIALADSIERANDAYEQGNKDEARQILKDQKKRLQTSGRAAGISNAKIQEKLAEMDEQSLEMKAAPAAPSAKRMRKASRAKSIMLQKSAEAF